MALGKKVGDFTLKTTSITYISDGRTMAVEAEANLIEQMLIGSLYEWN